MAVANVDIQVDARSALQQLKAVNQQSQQLESSANGATSAITRQNRELQTASNGMRYFVDATGRARAENGRFLSTAERAAAGIRNQGQAAERTSQQMKGLGVDFAALGRGAIQLAAAYATLSTVQQAVQVAVQREESSRRLQFLAKSYGEVAAAQEAAARAGAQFGLSTTEANQQFAQLFGRLRPLGISLADIEAAFVGFNTTAKVSGSTAEEASSALTQLAQALGSGALRGDELNSILEQAPGLVIAISKELNAPIGQIRKLASEGKLTSDVVIRALKRAAAEGADELNAALQGPSQQTKNLQNAFEDLQAEAAGVVLPAIISSVQGLTESVKTVTEFTKDFGDAWQLVYNKLAPVVDLYNKLANNPIAAGLRGNIGNMLVDMFLPAGTRPLIGMTQELAKLQRGQNNAPPPTAVRSEAAANAMQQRLLGQQVGTTGTSRNAAADKAAAERERAQKAATEEAKRVRDALIARGSEIVAIRAKSELIDKIAAAEAAGDEQLAIRLRGEEKALDLRKRYAELLGQEENRDVQLAIVGELRAQVMANQLDVQRQLDEQQRQRNQDQMNALQALIEKQYEMNTAIQQQIALADSVSASLGKGLTSTFDLLISGADNWAASLQQIASGVLVDIANQLIRIYVIEQAINAIKTFLTPFSYGNTPLGAGGGSVGGKGTFGPNYGFPARATGGSVTAGQPYLVGERGPELFMPGKSGGIAPAGSFGGIGNIVVNVDASGSSVQGDTGQGNRLGQVIGAAVRQELINQKRPGGLLA